MRETVIERHAHWRVTVETGGEHIVSIEPQMLAGREPSEADYDAIRTAAHHLLSFAASAVDPYDFRCEECDCRSFAIVQGSNGKPTAAIRCVECKRVYNIYAPTALHAKAGVSVKVKELEWEEIGSGFFRAKAPLFGSLRIEKYGDAFNVLYSIPGFCDTFTPGDFETAESAKAAAQQDYEARICSALSTTQEPWGWVIPRGQNKKPVILQYDTHDENSAAAEADIHNLGYFPIYAHQPATAGLEKALEALEPFAKVGRIIDGPFGPALFAEDDAAFQSGCAWTENGERKTLTWGQFRRATAAFAALKSEAGK